MTIFHVIKYSGQEWDVIIDKLSDSEQLTFWNEYNNINFIDLKITDYKECTIKEMMNKIMNKFLLKYGEPL